MARTASSQVNQGIGLSGSWFRELPDAYVGTLRASDGLKCKNPILTFWDCRAPAQGARAWLPSKITEVEKVLDFVRFFSVTRRSAAARAAASRCRSAEAGERPTDGSKIPTGPSATHPRRSTAGCGQRPTRPRRRCGIRCGRRCG
jgi:hypothetical protein